MKSKTSFFNFTVLRKDIFRYAPVWGLYAVCMIMFRLTPSLLFTAEAKAENLINSMSSDCVINMILGGVSALLVFGDLFKARLCYATHAMPMRREGWFLTHYTAGILFSLVPNLFITLCYLPMMGQYWYIALLWFAAVSLQYLFFFSLGVFSATCAGNRLGATAIYLILNLFSSLIGAYAEDIYTPLLYGLRYRSDFLNLFQPVSYISSSEFVICEREHFRIIGFFGGDWLYLAIVGVLGLVLALLAVLVYRKRQLETAGDFLSLPAAKPVFLVIYTLGVGYLFEGLFSGIGLFVGLFIGVFTGKMLLERTVRVFRGRTFLYWGVFTTLFLLSMGLTLLDPIGITRYVPETEDVEAVYFYDDYYRYNSDSSNSTTWSITEPAQIDEIRQFHENMADRRHKNSNEVNTSVFVQYKLKNGRTVLRQYAVPVNTPEGEFVRKTLSSWNGVFHRNDWDSLVADINQVIVTYRDTEYSGTSEMTDPVQIQGLLEAIRQDCDAGNMAQSWHLHPDEESIPIELRLASQTQLDSRGNKYTAHVYYLDIRECAQHTLAYLESLDLYMETHEK